MSDHVLHGRRARNDVFCVPRRRLPAPLVNISKIIAQAYAARLRSRPRARHYARAAVQRESGR
jgi:hypothetical protein